MISYLRVVSNDDLRAIVICHIPAALPHSQRSWMAHVFDNVPEMSTEPDRKQTQLTIRKVANRDPRAIITRNIPAMLPGS